MQTQDAGWFVKLNLAEHLALFSAEADGLAALAVCPEIRVPQVVASGTLDTHAFLILEYLQLNSLNAGRQNRQIAATAGRALAQLHQIENPRPGWHQDNFIGSTPQYNQWLDNWAEFFGEHRLRPQLRMAQENGHGGRLQNDGEKLLEQLPSLLAGHSPANSLLHGDLWQGNAALDETGKLAVYDPAVYFGDRETDLAMSELFGGFPPDFYAAYRETWPLADGYPTRRTLYQLYHILNHLNLFGSGYLHEAEKMIQSLLAAVR
jgi:fructosamine-3-kinase